MPAPPSGEPVLTASPETRSLDLEDMAQDLGPTSSMFWNSAGARELMLSEEPGDAEPRPRWHGSDLHPHVQTLSISDLEACVALENAAFPENERCSREKVCGTIGVV